MSEAIKLAKPQLAASEVPNLETEVTYPKWIQRKYDGICALAVNGVAMSRTMKPIPNLFIQKFFADNELHGWHGELMVRGDFNDVQSAVMRIEGEPDFYYAVYDNWDSDEPYHNRFADLGVFIKHPHERIHVVDTLEVNSAKEAEDILEKFVQEGYEGAMLRDPFSMYKQGRHTLKSQALLKLKRFYDDEAIITGFIEKLTNTNEKKVDERGYSKRSSKKEGMVPAGTLGAITVAWRNVEFEIGSGWSADQAQDIWNRREGLLKHPVTFKYQGVHEKTGIPRFGTYKALREEFNLG